MNKSEEYPNDKETQEWMNAPMGKPISTPEEQVRFWSDKYDAKVDELHEMWQEARSFEGSFNSATKMIAEQMEIIDRLTKETFKLKKDINHLKESRSKWAKQSSENADDLDKALSSWHMKCVRLEDRIDLMCDEFKRIKSMTDNQEIKGLCERGIQDIQQHVSVIAQRDNLDKKVKEMEAVMYAVGDYASNHKDDRFGSRRRLLEAYDKYEKRKEARP